MTRPASHALPVAPELVKTIAKKIDTPFYIYSAGKIRDRYETLRNALPENVDILYSLKANPNAHVARFIRALGAGAEIASAGELSIAKKCGFKQIFFAGPGKTDPELETAIRAGAVINAESNCEVDRIIRLAEKLRIKTSIGFRINISPRKTAPDGNAAVIFAGEGQKFGFGPREFFSAFPGMLKSLAKTKGLVTPAGFHISAGSQITDAGLFLAYAESILEFSAKISRKTGFRAQFIDFGGGLGIPFPPKYREIDLPKLARGLNALISDYTKKVSPDTKFYIEPGRYIVGESGVYVMRVIDIKKSGRYMVAITDGGIHHALLPIAVNQYPIVALHGDSKRGGMREYIVGGPLCTSKDVYPKPVSLPELKVGDLVGVLNSGAYGFTASMTLFLSRPAPAEVMTDENGGWKVI